MTIGEGEGRNITFFEAQGWWKTRLVKKKGEGDPVVNSYLENNFPWAKERQRGGGGRVRGSPTDPLDSMGKVVID